MRRLRLPSAIVAAALVATAASAPAVAAQAPAPARGALHGRVSAESAPLSRVTVYAYELAQLQVRKVISSGQGEFRFEDLPAGVYKLIAFKVGYQPAVIMLSRAATGAIQFVDLKLAQERVGDARNDVDFWTVRDQIPPDVLRDIESVRLEELAYVPAGRATRSFSTALRAVTGVEDLGDGREAQLAGGGIGMEGHIGPLHVDVTGEFWRLAGGAETAPAASDGQAAALAVRMAAAGEGSIDVTTVSHNLAGGRGGIGNDSADFERYRVSWSQPMGERSRSRFEAQYTSQSNFFGQSAAGRVPSATRAFNVEGAYQFDVGERASLETGIRYREGGGIASAFGEPLQALELFGRGGWELRPSVLVEYGLFTQLGDGTWALAPQGGVVVQLGQRWQALASASHRVEQGDGRKLDGFTPLRFSSAGEDCRDLDQSCYRVLLARQGAGEDMFAVGFLHREMAETLHLYFDDDFLNQLDSVYLVPGDQLPEVQLSVERRLTPRVLARLESSYAEGGGGILYAVGDSPYENSVRYLVTSLDTHFQQSSTGVFVAFHQVEQGARPAGAGERAVPVSELERLQLMLSQDLDVLARLAADWAVQVNFEVSRGQLPFSLSDPEADELRRRVTGGLSVKF